MGRVERTALISIGINIGLVVLKLALAFISGSLALIADAWHSGSDVAASALVWAGARISRRENRANLAVIENIIGIVIALLIFWAAVGIFQRVSVVATGTIRNLPIAIIGTLVAALASYYAAQYKLYVASETGSVSLMADGHHSRMDMLTSVAVVIGLMGHAIGIELDRIAAVVVTIFIVGSGVEILTASLAGLKSGSITRTGGFAWLADTRPVQGLSSFFERTGFLERCRFAWLTLSKPRSRRRAFRLAIGAVLLVWASTAVVFVGPGREGVLMRFGRAQAETLSPGAHLKAPWPIDRVARVEMPKIRRVELGFRTRDIPRAVTRVAQEFYATLWESRHAAGTYEKLPKEALRLTGDENIVDMNMVLLYRVKDAQRYLFSVDDAETYIRSVAEYVLGVATGSRAIDDVLTVDRGAFEGALMVDVQGALDAADVGVEVIGIQLQDIHPPLEVVPAFRDVASAREDKNRIINEAYGYMNQTVPRARGEGQQLISEATGASHARQSRAVGDADRFTAIAARYKNAQTVTETRLYIETMETLLAGVEKYIVSKDVNLKGYDIRLYEPTLGVKVPALE
ncbi:FtsH protease activity modulator HflK [bacterium]|nr:FtsH protease activity modulator HflK [bacterium]